MEEKITTKNQVKKTSIGMPDELRKLLQEEAKYNYTTVTGIILTILRDHYMQQGKLK